MSPVTSSRRAATSAARRHHRSRLAPNQSGVRAVVKRGRQTDTRQHPPILRRPAWVISACVVGLRYHAVHTQTVAVNGPAHVGVAGRHDKTYDIGAPSRHASIACWAQAGSSLKESHANTNQAARFGNWAHAKRCGKDARWTSRTREASLILSPMGIYANIADSACECRLLGWG